MTEREAVIQYLKANRWNMLPDNERLPYEEYVKRGFQYSNVCVAKDFNSKSAQLPMFLKSMYEDIARHEFKTVDEVKHEIKLLTGEHKKANEMFNELNWSTYKEFDHTLTQLKESFVDEQGNKITFELIGHSIMFSKHAKVDMPILKAINQKVLELGWDKEEKKE